jgi:hypothetical protein
MERQVNWLRDGQSWSPALGANCRAKNGAPIDGCWASFAELVGAPNDEAPADRIGSELRRAQPSNATVDSSSNETGTIAAGVGFPGTDFLRNVPAWTGIRPKLRW